LNDALVSKKLKIKALKKRYIPCKDGFKTKFQVKIMQIKLALRQFAQNRSFTALNIFGLSVGIAACLLLFRIVHFEWSFNRQFPHHDRIARIISVETDPSGQVERSSCIPIPAMGAMAQSVPSFELFSRVREIWPTLAVPDASGGLSEKKFQVGEDELAFFAEPSFLKIFHWKWLGGDEETALRDINSVVLTQKWAEKCFGSWQASLGQTVVMDNTVRLVVRGVVADPPVNCDFQFVFLVSYPTLKPNSKLYFYDEDWGACSSNNQAYALLRDNNQWAAANAALAMIGDKEYRAKDGQTKAKTHLLQPLDDLHFDEEIGSSGSHRMARNRLWVLTFIGLLILLMACFNFINLSTAQATLRAREVGVRKTLGSSRGQLLRQFMTETGLIVLCSVVIGAAVAAFCSPLLKHISDVPDAWPLFSLPVVWAFLLAATVLVTLLSGFYPAMVLAGFNPIKALRKDSGQQSVGGVPVRKVLVVGQFVIAQMLIIGTLVTISQLDYLRNMDLGFEKNLIYTMSFQRDSASQSKLVDLKQRLLAIPGVDLVSFSSDAPASGNTWSSNFALGRGKQDAPFNVSMKYCDADYLQNYGLRLVAGRWMQPSDTMREAVVNETLLRKLGVTPEDALGQEFKLGGGRRRPIVVGVVKDYHSHSLHEVLEPLLMSTRLQYYSEAGIRIRPDNLAATTAAIQKTFDAVYPEQVFEGRFFDERIASFYQNENRFAATCRGFAGLAILISCLGLFGLAAHAAARRTKEIGIRKVLGASVAGITGLLAKDFLKLVLIAVVIASPMAYYFMQKWLADFAYRVDMSGWVFLLSGALALAVAFMTVSFQSIKAALANPARSLKSE